MKKIKLNDEFLLVDGHVAKGGIKHQDKIYYYFCDAKNITEDQADDIVEWEEERQYYYLYPHKDWQGDITAIESLHSLIKSKGIYLYENPFPKPLNYDLWAKYGDFTQYGKTLTIDCLRWKESEEKTFYNPFIFKL